MTTKQQIEEFNQRWNITDEYDCNKEFQAFKNRVMNSCRNIDNNIVYEGQLSFCSDLGIKYDPYGNIVKSLNIETDHKKFYFILEVIINLPRYFFKVNSQAYYQQGLVKAVHCSNINLAIENKNERFILYPAGEPFLDQELVNQPLSFLSGKSDKYFVEALHFYESEKYADSAEKIRKSIEEFFRVKLNNQQGLDKNIKNLQDKLNTNGSPTEIRNIIFQILTYLDKYFNEHSKHKEAVDAVENEFLIYQAGLLMRYIDNVLK